MGEEAPQIVCIPFPCCLLLPSIAGYDPAVILRLRLKIIEGRIKFCDEYQSCRKFYVDIFTILNHMIFCHIKIVMKITRYLP